MQIAPGDMTVEQCSQEVAIGRSQDWKVAGAGVGVGGIPGIWNLFPTQV